MINLTRPESWVDIIMSSTDAVGWDLGERQDPGRARHLGAATEAAGGEGSVCEPSVRAHKEQSSL